MFRSIKEYFRELRSTALHTSLIVSCMNKNSSHYLSDYKRDIFDINRKLDKLLENVPPKDNQ